MGMTLSNQTEYLRKYNRIGFLNSKWIAGKLRKVRDLLMAFSPVLWIVFFLILTLLTNFLGGLLSH